jgi:DtxR family manganese transport transcriptional regulator
MALPDAKEQARRFARVREAHRTEMQEDYVELIGDLIAATGEARAGELAERFGVTAATVTNTLARLKKAGLIDTRPYRPILLTRAGEAVARRSRERHQLVLSFLLSLGVSKEVAETDSEGLEHHLSDETLRAMAAFAHSHRSPSGTRGGGQDGTEGG